MKKDYLENLNTNLETLKYNNLLLNDISNLNSFANLQFSINISLKTFDSENFSNVSYSLVPPEILQNSFDIHLKSNSEEISENNFLNTLDSLHSVNYKTKTTLQKVNTKDYSNINSKLSKRPWTLILASNTSRKLAEASEYDYYDDLLDEDSFWESINKIWEDQEINFKAINDSINNTLALWNDKVISDSMKWALIGLETAQNELSNWNNTISKYAGSSNVASKALGVASSAISGTSNAISQIKYATSSSTSTSDLMRMLGKGAAILRGSILNKNYLTNVQKGYVIEPISLSGMTFINKKGNELSSKTTKEFWGPYFVTGIGGDSKSIKSKIDQRNFNDIYKFKITPFKSQSTSTIHRYLKNIITSLDAQLQYFITYFTSIDKEGTESLLNLYIPTNNVNEDLSIKNNNSSEIDNKYYYFFYTNNFSFNPVKKATSTFNYSNIEITTPLVKPEGKNEFSFNLTSDLELTFWRFVTRNGLSYNPKYGYFSNTQKSPSNKSVNLHFLLLEQMDNEFANSDFYNNKRITFDVDNTFVNHFILKDVQFSGIDSLKFSQSFGQMKFNVKGIYNKLIWHHNEKISNLKF